MRRLLLAGILFIIAQYGFAQTISIIESKEKVSLRGLSVVTDKVIWASGSRGSVGKSIDGGKSWEWMKIPGFDSLDFRDIEGFDENTAIVIAIAEPAYIFKTTDGGKNWKTVFTDTAKGAFLDAMDFADAKHGVVIGDPIAGNPQCFYQRFTADGGETWTTLNDYVCKATPAASKGEAFFASSGTNIVYINESGVGGTLAVAVSGGLSARFIKLLGKSSVIPIVQGKETTGGNSIAAISKKRFIIVGGDFTKDTSRYMNCAYTNDGGITWFPPKVAPFGYRSCVEYINANRLITCGTSGVDISEDGGRTWRNISKESFHVCQKAKKGNAVFLAGKDGRIAKLN